MQITVWTEYKWECSKCMTINSVNYQPAMGKKLPKCDECGHNRDECSGIVEDCRPKVKAARSAS